MKTSRKDNWIVKVSKGTVTVIVYGEGREKADKWTVRMLDGAVLTPAWCHVG